MPKDASASPAHSASSQNEDQSLEQRVVFPSSPCTWQSPDKSKPTQQRAAQSHRKKQQAILDEGKELSRQYEISVKTVLDEGTAAEAKRVQQFQEEEGRLKDEIERTEKELLELLQVEASTVQLRSAAVQAEVEDWKTSQEASLASLHALAVEEGKGIDSAIEGLWQPFEEANETGNGEAK
ncbi:hypothetical protein JCM11251_000125 [Rhodosporidiobolus azoricus]